MLFSKVKEKTTSAIEQKHTHVELHNAHTCSTMYMYFISPTITITSVQTYRTHHKGIKCYIYDKR